MSSSSYIRELSPQAKARNRANQTQVIAPNGSVQHGQSTPNRSGEAESSQKPTTVSVATTIVSPALLTTLCLIFGGCCSNVYALESILSLSPQTGALVTFLQFVLTSLFTLQSQITVGSSGLPSLRKRSIPFVKWIIYTAFFLAINMLNNAAFGYRISVPLHIILRSAGPVTSMLIGYFVGGRRYTTRQIFAVVLLFIGVVLAALADAQTKSKTTRSSLQMKEPTPGPTTNLSDAIHDTKFLKQAWGFGLLFTALILSALMGLYTDNMYSTHGRAKGVTSESMFYSHTLSLPFFALQSNALAGQFESLVANATSNSSATLTQSAVLGIPLPIATITRILPKHMAWYTQPQYLTPALLLLANAVTQIVCISGVNRLSAQTNSLTVTVVLNVRKLVSLVLSILLFGNNLPTGVAVGAVLVFIGGGLYGWPNKTTKEQKPK